jgi:C1A family cysteine protease
LKDVPKDTAEFSSFNFGAAKPAKAKGKTGAGTKAKFKSLESVDTESFAFDNDQQLSSGVNLAGHLPPVRYQGSRGTCVAFAATDVNNFSFFRKTGQFPSLSVQYLFSEMKKLEGNGSCKAFLSSALAVIRTKGQCQENVWSYNPNSPCIQNDGAPPNTDQNALQFRNAGISLMGGDIVLKLRQVLTNGRIAAYAFPIYNSWYRNADTQKTGRLFMPFPEDEPLRDGDGEIVGHAVSVVGFQDESTAPGGGYFIIRNSWGPQFWGRESIYGQGYGTVPYAFLKQYIWELVTI